MQQVYESAEDFNKTGGPASSPGVGVVQQVYESAEDFNLQETYDLYAGRRECSRSPDPLRISTAPGG